MHYRFWGLLDSCLAAREVSERHQPAQCLVSQCRGIDTGCLCSDLACAGEQVATIYQKRWKVEEFHKSLKSNAGLAKSPTRTGDHTKQPCLYGNLCGVQAGVLKDKTQNQSFCFSSKAAN